VSSYRTKIGTGSRSSSASPILSRDTDEVPLQRCIAINCSLRVDESICQDAGVYTLEAENIAGSAHCTCLVRVEENPLPKVIIPRWTNIESHYYVLRTLGVGEYSYAHLLIDKQTNREYVGKFYALNEAMKKFCGAQELECLSRLSHNNVVELIEALVSDNVLVLVTERLVGRHIIDGVLSCHSWTEAGAAAVIRQVLEAVAHVHSEGVVHLDIQPENLVFAKPLTQSRDHRAGSRDLMSALAPLSGDTAGTGGKSDFGIMSCWIKLIGFSMAQPLVNVTNPSENIVRRVRIPYKCRPDFASPEFIKTVQSCEEEKFGESLVGTATDIWSIGIITYLLLTGKHPFSEALKKDSSKISTEEFVFDSGSNPDLQTISEEAKDFLTQVLQHDANNRPSAHRCLMHPWIQQIVPSTRSLQPVLQNLKSYLENPSKATQYLTNSDNEQVMVKMVEWNDQLLVAPQRRESRSVSIQPEMMDSPVRSSLRDLRGKSMERDLFRSLNMIKSRASAERSTGSSTNSSLLRISDDLSLMPESQHLTNFRRASSACRTGIYGSPSLSGTNSMDRRGTLLGTMRSRVGSIEPDTPAEIVSSEQSTIQIEAGAAARQYEDELVLPIASQLIAPEEKHLIQSKIDRIKKADSCQDDTDEMPTSNLIAPIIICTLRDVYFSVVAGEARFACQLASPVSLPNSDQLMRSGNTQCLTEIYGTGMNFSSHGSVAAAWYLDGNLLSDGPGVFLGAAAGGWLWLYLQELGPDNDGSIVECIVRNRAGIARTASRLILAEIPKPPCRPGILWVQSDTALISWATNDLTSSDDIIYRLDVKSKSKF
ncbi:hypothetical protein Ciccas_011027, partial [Cichlidogyrus casuarinus]